MHLTVQCCWEILEIAFASKTLIGKVYTGPKYPISPGLTPVSVELRNRFNSPLPLRDVRQPQDHLCGENTAKDSTKQKSTREKYPIFSSSKYKIIHCKFYQKRKHKLITNMIKDQLDQISFYLRKRGITFLSHFTFFRWNYFFCFSAPLADLFK